MTNKLQPGKHYLKTDSKGFRSVLRLPDEKNDFTVNDSTSMRDYEEARRQRKNIVTVDLDSNVVMSWQVFMRNHPELVSKVEVLTDDSEQKNV